MPFTRPTGHLFPAIGIHMKPSDAHRIVRGVAWLRTGTVKRSEAVGVEATVEETLGNPKNPCTLRFEQGMNITNSSKKQEQGQPSLNDNINLDVSENSGENSPKSSHQKIGF